MTRFMLGDDRSQSTLFPERLDDYLGDDNPVRAIDIFVDELDLAKFDFGGVEPAATGRPAYHPATLLKIYSLLSDQCCAVKLKLRSSYGAGAGVLGRMSLVFILTANNFEGACNSVDCDVEGYGYWIRG